VLSAPRAADSHDAFPSMCIYTHFHIDAFVFGVYEYTMNSQEIIKALVRDGWTLVGQKGSHVQFKHPTKPGRATVPHPKKDVPIGTLRSIEKQSGLKLK
jgi:predicted RNA binding protein YcfA (HicA-like mRNA interferase family)